MELYCTVKNKKNHFVVCRIVCGIFDNFPPFGVWNRTVVPARGRDFRSRNTADPALAIRNNEHRLQYRRAEVL